MLHNAFQDNDTEYGNMQQTVNLLFKRRAYFTAIIHFQPDISSPSGLNLLHTDVVRGVGFPVLLYIPGTG